MRFDFENIKPNEILLTNVAYVKCINDQNIVWQVLPPGNVIIAMLEYGPQIRYHDNNDCPHWTNPESFDLYGFDDIKIDSWKTNLIRYLWKKT